MDILNYFSEEILWGVANWRFYLAILLVFLGFASRRLILYAFKGFLSKKAKDSEARWDDEFVGLMPTPLALLAQIILWYLATFFLSLPEKPTDIRLYTFQGLEFALAVSVMWLGTRVTDVISNVLSRISAKTESKLDDQLIPLCRKTIKVIIVATIGVMAIQNMGYSVTSMIASIGVGGLALALAAKDTIANVFGSVVVFTDRPFQIGDSVEFSGIQGTVEEVGFRTTLIRRFDKSLVTVPNATFSSNPIINYSRRTMRRLDMIVGVTYETKSDQMRQFLESIRELLRTHKAIDQGFHFAHFVKFADSSLEVEIYCFTKSTVWTDFLEAQEDIMLKIMDIAESQGLEIAFPTRTVYLRDENWKEKHPQKI